MKMEIIKFLVVLSITLVICFSPLIVGGIQDAKHRKKILANFTVGNVYGRLELTDKGNPYAEENPIKLKYCFVITDIRYNKKKQLYYKYKMCDHNGIFICAETPHGICKFNFAEFENLVLIKQEENYINVNCNPPKKLEWYNDVDKYGNCYGLIPPTKTEIIEKINEIIDYINRKEERL